MPEIQPRLCPHARDRAVNHMEYQDFLSSFCSREQGRHPPVRHQAQPRIIPSSNGASARMNFRVWPGRAW